MICESRVIKEKKLKRDIPLARSTRRIPAVYLTNHLTRRKEIYWYLKRFPRQEPEADTPAKGKYKLIQTYGTN